MKIPAFLKPMNPLAFGLLLIVIGAAAHAEVTVTNVKAAQRPGSKLMDITYDVTSTDSPTVNISLIIWFGLRVCSAPPGP